MMARDDAAHDREPEPVTAGVAAARRVHPQEAAAELRQHLVGDARARVLDGEHDLGGLGAHGELDGAAARVAGRVVEQVREYLLDAQRIRELPEHVSDAAPLAADCLDARARHRALARALAGMAAPVRTALRLRYEEDLSYEEMARRSGERAGTLQARVARTLPLLRRCVEPAASRG